MGSANFYYCFDAEDALRWVLAEVRNTPWNERHAYVLRPPASVSRRRAMRFRLSKAFHVSPFMPMDQEYDWTFGEPGEALRIRMVNRGDGARVFDAALALDWQP